MHISTYVASNADDFLSIHFENDTTPLLNQKEAPSDHLKMMRTAWSSEASVIVDHLMRYAPGGLVDAIFGELCRRKASVFVVSHESVEAQK